jgi:hypothetical protein
LVWLNPATGQQLSTPFQPNLQAGSTPAWRPAGLASDDAQELVVSDGQATIYRVGVKAQPTSHLAALAENHDLAAAIVTPVAPLGKVAYAVDSERQVLSFMLPSLKPGEPIALGGQPTFGPERIGERVLVASDQNELLALDGEGKLVWRQKLEHGSLAGRPLPSGQDFIVASKEGAVWKISASGEQSEAKLIGQPLASGPVAFGNHLVLAGHDGTVFVIDRP